MGTSTFRGGVHPPEEKQWTANRPFEMLPPPAIVILPLTQHLGKPATALVRKGDTVRAGTVIAREDGMVSVPVHSPVHGSVKSVGREPHSSGFPKDAIVIAADGEAETDLLPPCDPEIVTAAEIRERVREAGIVGQGGAAFPTHVKLTPPPDAALDLLILNGCECEPYLTRDERLMIERSADVVLGMRLMMQALGVRSGIICIEDNKPEAISRMRDAASGFKGLSVQPVRTKYPQGAEKMLIHAVTGRTVPPGKLPLNVGLVIQNVGTAVAVADAVVHGVPQLTAALTVSGRGVREPRNVIAPVGTPIRDVLDFCGGVTEDAAMVIVGGPMMGVAQHDLTAPLMKATSGIVVLTHEDVQRREETACLRCGECIEGCPLGLTPTRLARYAQLNRDEEAEAMGVTVCMECGTCAYACPAGIPLVQWMRLGKQRVLAMQRARTQQP